MKSTGQRPRGSRTAERVEASAIAQDALERYLSAAGLRPLLQTVATGLAAQRASTRKDVARRTRLSRTRVAAAAEELRHLYLARKPCELPLRVLHEAIAWWTQPTYRHGYRLPARRRPFEDRWQLSLPYLRRYFALLDLPLAEAQLAELLTDPDMLNEQQTAEILGISRNRDDTLRRVLRARVGASRRGELRLRLLRGALGVAHRSSRSRGDDSRRQPTCPSPESDPTVPPPASHGEQGPADAGHEEPSTVDTSIGSSTNQEGVIP